MPIFSFAGKRPQTLGVKDGQLAACPKSPNCVSSQAPDADRQIPPLVYGGTQAEALTPLKGIIEAMEGAALITATEDYLHAEFTSKLMGYVDDFECYFPSDAQVIHVRSASRLGQSDLGVNRDRVEKIRQQLQAT